MASETPGLTLDQDGKSPRIRLTGPWVLRHLSGSINKLRRQLARCKSDPQTIWDLEAIDGLDSTGALLLWRHWGRRRPAQLRLRTEYEPLFQRRANSKAQPFSGRRDSVSTSCCGISKFIPQFI